MASGRRTDAGRTWKPIFDDQPVAAIGAIALAPSNPQVIYVGTGEADMRSDISQGEGLYKSSDGGRSWSFSGLADSQQIARILVHPGDPDRVYVAALGHPYGPNAERGVFASRDGGRSWRKLLGNDENTGAIDLAFEPGNPDVIYAALWQTRRTPWNIYPPSTGPGTGLWKSVDGGEHWRALTGYGFPDAPGRIGLALGRTAPQRVYAIVDGTGDGANGGLYRSDDGGLNWKHASSDPRIWGRGWYFGGIKVDPRDADHLYALNTAMFESRDGGKSFVPTRGDPTGDDFHEMWIDDADPARQILGVDQGAIVTLNDGATWSSWLNQPTGQFYTVSTDNQFPYWVYGSQQDSGAAGVPSRTTQRDGINLTHFRESTAGGESDNIAPDPLDPQILYGGRVDKLDLRTMQTRSVDPTLGLPDHYRSVWTMPLVFSHRDPRTLYFANQRLFRTVDGGEHWTPISPDLTREDPGTPANLDPPTAAHHLQIGPRRGVIFTIGPSRLADGEIWVGTDDGFVWRTLDDGGHWQNLTPPTLTGWSKIGSVEPSHHDRETAYVAVDRHRLDDFAPYIFRTHDGGSSWKARRRRHSPRQLRQLRARGSAAARAALRRQRARRLRLLRRRRPLASAADRPAGDLGARSRGARRRSRHRDARPRLLGSRQPHSPAPGRPGGRGRATRGCPAVRAGRGHPPAARRFHRHALPGRGTGGEEPAVRSGDRLFSAARRRAAGRARGARRTGRAGAALFERRPSEARRSRQDRLGAGVGAGTLDARGDSRLPSLLLADPASAAGRARDRRPVRRRRLGAASGVSR